MDINKKTYTLPVAGRDLKFEISRLASQANASVLASYGDTVVLATVVMGKEDRGGDFFPLLVDYEEKFYAAGKILGSRFVRREGKASDEAVLSARLIDRAIRPLFNHRLRRDVQVILTIISIDEENDPDFVALQAASLALAISDIPWSGPVAGVGVSSSGDKVVINPTFSELKSNAPAWRGFFAGVTDKINMIEVSGNEAGEADIVNGFAAALTAIASLVDFQNKIVADIGKTKSEVALSIPSDDLKAKTEAFLSDRLEAAVFTPSKSEHQKNLSTLLSDLKSHLLNNGFEEDNMSQAESVFEEAIDALVHDKVLRANKRVDGRALDEVRPLYAEVGLFNRTHGSAIFMRGDTQAMGIVTLAPPGQEKTIETIESIGKKRFFLHYNFPPYSVGEVKPMRGPGRREIGHGALAEKALRPMVPSTDDFPYTIRVVSEILGSNGSSSMASVCTGSLALMNAGVPMKKPVAGIAMGIMTAPDGTYKVLTDIQGPEDHYGDMDFKVAGTKDGITALQLDVKIDGVTLAMLKDGLTAAGKARLHILEVMNRTLPEPNPKLSPFAPAVDIIKIDPDKIGAVIGSGGKTINALTEKYEVTIDIDDDGSVFIGGLNQAGVAAAKREIESLTKEFEVGEIVEGPIIKIMDFGAILDLGGGRDGMIHVSELADGFVKNVSDVVKEGDVVKAKVVKIDNGRIGLSIKQLAAKK